MHNGNAALQLAFEPAPALAEAAADKRGSPVSAELGEAMASATTAFCYAFDEHRNYGGLRPETRTAIGERVGRVAMLALGHEGGDQDFAVHARDAGRPILRRCLGAEYFRRFSPTQGDEAIDFFLDGVLGVVGRVVETERALQLAMAH